MIGQPLAQQIAEARPESMTREDMGALYAAIIGYSPISPEEEPDMPTAELRDILLSVMAEGIAWHGLGRTCMTEGAVYAVIDGAGNVRARVASAALAGMVAACLDATGQPCRIDGPAR